MKFINFFRSLLVGKYRRTLATTFPVIFKLYQRYFLLKILKYERFLDRDNDCLNIGESVLPLNVLCPPYMIGLSSLIADIVYPMLPNMRGIQELPYHEGPYILGNVNINKGDVVFDCGANLGLFSLMAANFDCTCYAFEPLPKNISNIETIMKFHPHIILAPFAVSDADGVVQFTNDEFKTSSNKIITSTNDVRAGVIEVNAVSLDSFVQKNNISRVDFIKADIEGAERLLLKGAKGILKDFSPKLSLCKYHLPDDPQILRELILDANPNYIIEERYKKIYAYVPN